MTVTGTPDMTKTEGGEDMTVTGTADMTMTGGEKDMTVNGTVDMTKTEGGEDMTVTGKVDMTKTGGEEDMIVTDTADMTRTGIEDTTKKDDSKAYPSISRSSCYVGCLKLQNELLYTLNLPLERLMFTTSFHPETAIVP